MNIKGKEMRNISNNLISILCSEDVKLYVVMRDWWPNYIVLRRKVVWKYFQDDCVFCAGKYGEYKVTFTQQLSLLVINSVLLDVFSLHFPQCALNLDNHGVLRNKPNVTEYTVRSKSFGTVFF